MSTLGVHAIAKIAVEAGLLQPDFRDVQRRFNRDRISADLILAKPNSQQVENSLKICNSATETKQPSE